MASSRARSACRRATDRCKRLSVADSTGRLVVADSSAVRCLSLSLFAAAIVGDVAAPSPGWITLYAASGLAFAIASTVR
jgi:hypothetical protein